MIESDPSAPVLALTVFIAEQGIEFESNLKVSTMTCEEIHSRFVELAIMQKADVDLWKEFDCKPVSGFTHDKKKITITGMQFG